ncbi:MAG: family 20 glycosylhydrolase [Clostridia bacterium]|nr:family 20 glycosylhydrolase [Clostridia bacterium]
MSTRITKRALSLFLTVCILFSSLTVTVIAEDGLWTPSENTKIFVDVDSVEFFENLNYEANFFASEYEAVLGTAPTVTMGHANEVGSVDILLTRKASVPAQGYEVSVDGSQLTVAASDDDGLFYGWHYVIKQLKAHGKVSEASETPDVPERSVSLDNGRKYYSVDWIKQLIREMAWSDMNTLVLHFSEDMGLGLESKLYPWLNGRDGRFCAQATLEEDFDDRYLTQEEFLEIAEYAKAYHVDLVPSMETPGQMNYIVYMFNLRAMQKDGFTFSYEGKTYNTVYNGTAYEGYEVAEDGTQKLIFTSKYGIGNYLYLAEDGTSAVVQGSSIPKDPFVMNRSRGIDISNEIAVAFTKSLIAEYAELFRGVGATKIDLGGSDPLGDGGTLTDGSKWLQLDHWKAYAIEQTGNSKAVAYDAYILYLNDLNTLARELGYDSVRVAHDTVLRTQDTEWNGVAQLDTNVDVWFRATGANTAWTYTGAGYQVYNALKDYTRYTMTGSYYGSGASAEDLYTEWCPYRFDPHNKTLGTGDNAAIGNANVLGGTLEIRCDNPTLRTEDGVMEDVLPMIRATGAKAWDSTKNARVSYTDFFADWNRIGETVDVNLAAINSFIPDPAALRAAVRDSATVDVTAYGEISYGIYMTAVREGQAVLDRGAVSQAEIDQAVLAIQNAKAALTTDKGALEAAIAEAESITEDMYSPASYTAYMNAVEAGRDVLANTHAPQSEIIAACNAILAAKAQLTADKAALRNELDSTPSLDTMDLSRFPEEILDLYNDALADAEAVLADPAATQSRVDEALEAFQYAKGYFFVDYSALEAEVAKADEVEANKDLYAPFYYEDYMYAIHEAKTYYLGEDAYPFHQTHVDAMTSMLRSGHFNLVNYCTAAQLTKDIVKLIERYYNEDLPLFKSGVYSVEMWMFYSSIIKGAENLILGSYTYGQIEDRIELIDEYRNMLIPEAMVTQSRRDIIKGVSSQVTNANAGSVVRLQVDTIRSFDSSSVIVLDENGFMVTMRALSVAPFNRRKPNQKLLYVDILPDLKPGTHTYTVYAADPTATHPFVLFCGDPVEISITVN